LTTPQETIIIQEEKQATESEKTDSTFSLDSMLSSDTKEEIVQPTPLTPESEVHPIYQQPNNIDTFFENDEHEESTIIEDKQKELEPMKKNPYTPHISNNLRAEANES
jgi:hypothetical protein